MKKHMGTFFVGMLAGAALCGAGALALTSGAIGTVEFNIVGLMQGEEQVFYAGEDALLGNGYLVPTSILFTDPSGNGTTYLSVRRMAELFNMDIQWDSAEGSIILPAAVTPPPAPTEVPADAPTEVPADAPTEVPADAPTEVPTQSPAE